MDTRACWPGYVEGVVQIQAHDASSIRTKLPNRDLCASGEWANALAGTLLALPLTRKEIYWATGAKYKAYQAQNKGSVCLSNMFSEIAHDEFPQCFLAGLKHKRFKPLYVNSEPMFGLFGMPLSIMMRLENPLGLGYSTDST